MSGIGVVFVMLLFWRINGVVDDAFPFDRLVHGNLGSLDQNGVVLIFDSWH